MTLNFRFGVVPALVVGLCVTGAGAGAQQLRPFDHAGKDPSFLKYRTALIAALRSGEIDAVVAAAAPNIFLDFGGGKGRVLFRKNLMGDKATHGPGFKKHAADYRRSLWRLLRLGGGFRIDDEAEAG